MGPFDVLGINPLLSIRASRYRWQSLGEFNLSALPLSIKPAVLALIANTTIVVGEITEVNEIIDTNIHDQAVSVVLRKNTYNNFYATLVEFEPVVKKAFKANPEVYEKEFFPDNLLEYRRAIISEQSGLTKRLKLLTEKYSDKFDPEVKGIFDGFNHDYIEASKTQVTASQNLSLKRAEYKNILKRFKRQIWINMLTIAGAYIDDEGIAAKYFNQSVLHPYHKNRKGENVLKPLKITIKANAIVLADFAYVETDKIIIECTGKVSVWYFTTDVELVNMIIPEDAVEVREGEEVMLLGSNLKKCFYVANKETDKTAKVELSLM